MSFLNLNFIKIIDLTKEIFSKIFDEILLSYMMYSPLLKWIIIINKKENILWERKYGVPYALSVITYFQTIHLQILYDS